MAKLYFKSTSLSGIKLVTRRKTLDDRGSLTRIFCVKEISKIYKKLNLKQINLSFSKQKHTLRGLHFQKRPYAETKLVTCIKGSILDVVVDLRRTSKTFLKFFSVKLTEKNKVSLLIPEGFAHGFMTLEKNCEILYLHTEFYKPNFETGIKYNDPQLNIPWPHTPKKISKRDLNFQYLSENLKKIYF